MNPENRDLTMMLLNLLLAGFCIVAAGAVSWPYGVVLGACSLGALAQAWELFWVGRTSV